MRFSIYCSLGSKLARISVVLWVSTCFDFCKSLILNLYLYKSVSLFFNLSRTSYFSFSNIFIYLILSSRLIFSAFFFFFCSYISFSASALSPSNNFFCAFNLLYKSYNSAQSFSNCCLSFLCFSLISKISSSCSFSY